MLRWPTSELPICPSGSPTWRSDASIVVCGDLAQQPPPVRHVGVRDRIVRRVALARAEAVEDQQHDRSRTLGAGRSGEGRSCGRAEALANDRVRYHLGGLTPSRKRMAFVQENWLLILVAFAVGRDARLAARAAPALADEGHRHDRGHAAHQFARRDPARRARAEGVRRRAPAERDARSAVADRGRAVRSSRSTRASRSSRTARAGPAAAAAGAALAKAGLTEVYHLNGGFRAWKDAGLPVEK